PYDLADQPPEGDGMIPVRGSRSPPWWLGGERRAHRVPVVERFVREHVPDGRQPGTMSQEPSHRQCGLVRGGELGPVAGYRRVDVETAFRDQAVRAERRHALGAGGDVDERVALPGLRAVEVRMTAPEVDDGLAVDDHRDGRADLVLIAQVPGERVAHGLEAWMALTLDLGKLGHGTRRIAPCGRRCLPAVRRHPPDG